MDTTTLYSNPVLAIQMLYMSPEDGAQQRFATRYSGELIDIGEDNIKVRFEEQDSKGWVSAPRVWLGVSFSSDV